jgi:uncharacterized cupredoxin-like copper-binding protein
MGIRRKVLGTMTAVVILGGCGGGSDHGMSHDGAATPSRTVDVEMRDIAYAPTAVDVKAGETVKFVFHNQGQIRHDAFIGDEAAQAEHEKEMRGGDSGGMGGHQGDDAIKVDPGMTGSLTHTFKPGESLVIGCHEAGHYAAGMKLALKVS